MLRPIAIRRVRSIAEINASYVVTDTEQTNLHGKYDLKRSLIFASFFQTWPNQICDLVIYLCDDKMSLKADTTNDRARINSTAGMRRKKHFSFMRFLRFRF